MEISNNFSIPSNNRASGDAPVNQSDKDKKNVSIFGDKNNNGILDRGDFSEEDLAKIDGNELLQNFEGQKWTDNLKNIFSSIMNNTSTKEKEIKDEGSGKTDGSIQEVIYESDSKTLKIAQKNIVINEYFNYKEYKFDDKGRFIESKRLMGKKGTPYKHPDGKTYGWTPEDRDGYIRSQGFDKTQDVKQKETYNKIMSNPENEENLLFKINRKYDEFGNYENY